MPFGFFEPDKATSTDTWEPTSVDPIWPDSRPVDYSGQLKTRTADDTVYVQDLGPREEIFELQFELMDKADRDSYLAFYDAVKKGFKKFEYEDRDAVLHMVRIANKFNLKEDRPGQYSGSILLEKE